MKAADTTLYWAKADGRDRCAVFDAERHARRREPLRAVGADARGAATGASSTSSTSRSCGWPTAG